MPLRTMLGVVGLVVLGILLGLAGLVGYNRYQHYVTDELNHHAAMVILQYNIQQGILKVPPELQPPPPPTITGVKPDMALPKPEPKPEKK